MKYLKYFLPGLLFLLGFCIFSLNIKAATVDSFNFLGKEIDDEWLVSSNGSISGQISFKNSVNSIDTTTGNFVYVDVCTTGYEPTLWITSNSQGQLTPSTKWYKVNTTCYVNNYKASVYRQIIFIANSEYMGQCSINGGTSLSCSSNLSNGRLFSNTDYNVYMRLLHFGITESIPLDDLIYDNQTTQTTILNDILSSIRSDNSINQQVKENTEKQLEEQKKQLEEQKKTNDTLTDDTVDSSKTKIEDKSADASKSPISSLLTLPLKILGNINTGLSGACSPFSLGTMFGTELILPCINLENRLGSWLWGLIDSFFCIFLIYNVGMLAVKIWTDVIMMKDFFSQLYKPDSEKGDKKE